MVCDPDIVILDEPFSGLDPVNSQILQEVVKELIGMNKIVIFSSHQMSYVEEFCEDIVMINKGEVVLEGNLLDIKKEFGKDQLVVSDVNKSVEEVKEILTSKFADCVAITGTSKQDVIVKLNDGVSRTDFLQKIAAATELEVEHFETYKPSLNDIFVAKVGEE